MYNLTLEGSKISRAKAKPGSIIAAASSTVEEGVKGWVTRIAPSILRADIHYCRCRSLRFQLQGGHEGVVTVDDDMVHLSFELESNGELHRLISVFEPALIEAYRAYGHRGVSPELTSQPSTFRPTQSGRRYSARSWNWSSLVTRVKMVPDRYSGLADYVCRPRVFSNSTTSSCPISTIPSLPRSRR